MEIDKNIYPDFQQVDDGAGYITEKSPGQYSLEDYHRPYNNSNVTTIVRPEKNNLPFTQLTLINTDFENTIEVDTDEKRDINVRLLYELNDPQQSFISRMNCIGFLRHSPELNSYDVTNFTYDDIPEQYRKYWKYGGTDYQNGINSSSLGSLGVSRFCNEMIIPRYLFSDINVNLIDKKNGYATIEKLYTLKPKDKTDAGDIYSDSLWNTGEDENYYCIGINSYTTQSFLSDGVNIKSSTRRIFPLFEKKYNNSYYYYTLPVFSTFAKIKLNKKARILERPFTRFSQNYGYQYGSTGTILENFSENIGDSTYISPFYCQPNNVSFSNLINGAKYGSYFIYNNILVEISNDDYNFYQFNAVPIKDIFSFFAIMGIPFSVEVNTITKPKDILSNPKYDNTWYCGVFNEDGSTYGDWVQGDDINISADSTTINPDLKPIDPDEEPDVPVTPDDDGDINIGSVPVGITNAFTNCYIMNTGAVDYAGKILWSGLGSQQAESGLTFGGMVKNFFGLFTDVKSETTDSTYRELALNTILDYFVSLRYYPIQNLFSYTQATVTDHLSVGTGQEPIVMAATGGFGVPQRRIVQMSGGQLTRAELNASGKVYNSFLDYQPNTTAILYIPYCGTVELTPSQLLDCDTIDIVYALDIMTGALSAIAIKNGTASYPLAMLQGTCGFETLVSGSNKGIVELATSISNLRFGANTSNQIVQGLANSAIGSASQNAENAEVNTQAMLIRGIASAYNAGTSMYNYLVGLPTMTGVSPVSAGSMSSLASTIMPQTAYIQLTKHSADIPTNFENTYGRTTNVYGSIGSYQGYLICGNPRLEGIPCTEHERDEIFSLLTTGVYVE